MPVNRKRGGGRRAQGEGRGQTLLEVALMMPVLILIIAGVVDLGRAFVTLIALTDAAAEGASYAAIYPSRTSEIAERAADSSSMLLTLEVSDVTVDTGGSATPGNPVTVTIEYDYVILTPIVNALTTSGTIPLRVTEVRPIIGE